MFVKALKSKIHAATVTETKLHYTGSLAVDSELMAAAGILPYEAVLMADVTNGSRAETYIIPVEAGSGKIVVLGAAARLFNPGDTIIILNFGYYTPQEAKKLKPKVIVVDENNKIKKLL
jgi:aspartate 1-decarboxylase